MITKLTLRMDKEIIEPAKVFAKKRKTSLSLIVSGYLSSLDSGISRKKPISPLVREISGVLPVHLDPRRLTAQYRRHLVKKYH